MKTFKKFFIVLTLFCVILTGVFVMPAKKAESAIAVPIGVGGYAATLVAVGGLLTYMGATATGEDLSRQGESVWKSLKESTKKVFKDSAAIVRMFLEGKEIEVVEYDFSDLLIDRTAMRDFTDNATQVVAHETYIGEPAEIVESEPEPLFVTAYPNFQVRYTQGSANVFYSFTDNTYFMVNTGYGIQIYKTIQFFQDCNRTCTQTLFFTDFVGNVTGRNETTSFKPPAQNIPNHLLHPQKMYNGVKYIEQFYSNQTAFFGHNTVTLIDRERALKKIGDWSYDGEGIEKTKEVVSKVDKAILPISTVIEQNGDITFDGVDFRDKTGTVIDSPAVPLPVREENGAVTLPVKEVGKEIDVITKQPVRDIVVEDEVPVIKPDDGMIGLFTSFYDWIVGVLNDIRAGIKSIATMTGITTVISAISTSVDHVADWTDSFFNSMATTLDNSLEGIDTFAKEFWAGLDNSLAALNLDGITKFTDSFWSTYTGAFEDGIAGITDWTNSFWDSYSDSFAKGMTGIDTFAKEFWGSMTGALSNAFTEVNAFIQDFPSILAGIFIPTITLVDWWVAIQAAWNRQIQIPDIDEFTTFTDLACIGVADMYADIMGMRVKVFDGSYVIKYSYWWKNIASGLMWFLAVWWIWRKVIGLFNRQGGNTP